MRSGTGVLERFSYSGGVDWAASAACHELFHSGQAESRATSLVCANTAIASIPVEGP